MHGFHRSILVASVLTVGAWTRAATPEPAAEKGAPAAATTASPATTSTAGAASAASSPGEAEKYTLKVGDRMQYRIAEDPVRGIAPMVVAVNSSGEASFPVSRDYDLRLTFEARGRTVREMKEEITRRLLADYYHQATVELTLEEKTVLLGKVQFFGKGGVSVEVPILPDAPPLKLSETLLRQRPPEYANLRRVKIRRLDAGTGQEKVIEVNVEDIIKNGQRDKDPVLQDGDRVEVPEKWIN